MRAILLSSAFAAITLAVSGCGLFSDDGGDPLDVTVEQEVPIEFTVDSEDLCPPGEDCSADPQPSPERIQSPMTVQIPVDIDVVEITGDPELREISSRVREITVTGVEYEVLENTLNVATEPISFFLGPQGAATSDSEGVVLVTTVPEIPAGQTPTETVPASEEAQGVTSELFRDLKFTALPSFRPTVEEGELFPPQGQARIRMNVQMRFTANPKDL